MVTTRHVTAIETLDDTNNKLVQDALEDVDDDLLEAVALSYVRTARLDAAKPEEGLTDTRNNMIQKLSTKRKIAARSNRGAVLRSTRVKQESRRKAEADGDLDWTKPV